MMGSVEAAHGERRDNLCRYTVTAPIRADSRPILPRPVMKTALSALLALTMVAAPVAAEAGPGPYRERPVVRDIDSTGGISVGGRAPWNQAWEYDSGSDNDRRPELPYYQQGRGQQTGGPARNLLPDDGLRIFPR